MLKKTGWAQSPSVLLGFNDLFRQCCWQNAAIDCRVGSADIYIIAEVAHFMRTINKRRGVEDSKTAVY